MAKAVLAPQANLDEATISKFPSYSDEHQRPSQPLYVNVELKYSFLDDEVERNHKKNTQGSL